MSTTLLKYTISNWAQLTDCLSNNSRDFYITVSSFVGELIQGKLIEVHHTQYGTVFAAMTDGTSGAIISAKDEDSVEIPWLTTSQILQQLEKFGFIILFNEPEYLSGDQLTYLMTLRSLNFDHISPIEVIRRNKDNVLVAERTIVAFNAATTPDWLCAGCQVKERDFLAALARGDALNVSAMTRNRDFIWNWLTYVANIEDILEENSGSSAVDSTASADTSDSEDSTDTDSTDADSAGTDSTDSSSTDSADS